MKRFLDGSFRNRLLAAFLVVSLIPLLICSTFLLQIFRLRLSNDAQKNAAEQLNTVLLSMDALCDGLASAAASVQKNPVVSAALSDRTAQSTLVYHELFSAVQEVRDYARFDLYDITGHWHYSSHTLPYEMQLPVYFGVLRAATASGEPLKFVVTEDVSNLSTPPLRAAVLLTDGAGVETGYLLISMDQTNLRLLLDGTYGAQNDLLILSQYWRPIYCTQPALTASLAEELRQLLLTDAPLDSAREDFRYSIAEHDASGLYMVLQQPQVFTHSTINILYTVNITSVLICLVISIFMSLQVTRQLFTPIDQLNRGFQEVERNNLDVTVTLQRRDELGLLAQRFNKMVSALKRNQEQLIENQKELNHAQIRMLQAQFNPHFLCNTLDTMKWISKINKVPQVALMSTNLADILRFCISPDEFVPLCRDAEVLYRYIEIQKIRLSDSFTFQLILPPDLEHCLVPKMILQPLVENAILHGLEGMDNGLIRVEAEEPESGLLQIVVSDNGRGLPPGMVGAYSDHKLPQKHLGLYNVGTILLKHYGAGFGLSLENQTQGTGAVITATLPIHREDKDSC